MKNDKSFRKDKIRAMWIAIDLTCVAILVVGGWFLASWKGVLLGIMLVLLILFQLGRMVYKGSLLRNKKLVDLSFFGEHENAPSWWLKGREEMNIFNETDVEDCYINSFDNLKLHALFIPGNKDEKRVVIICHCYHRFSMNMAEYAALYNKKYGFHVLMPDARGHGGSGGSYAGMGWHDRFDYLSWINYIIEKMGEDCEIILHGVSMGGASVMFLSGEDLPKQVKFGIEDCGYSNIKELFRFQLRYHRHYPLFPIYFAYALSVRMYAGFDPKDASCLMQLQKAKIPMIFIHGEKDDVVPPWMVHDAYEAANCSEKKLITIPDAAHAEAMKKDEEGLIEEEIDAFIMKYTNNMGSVCG